MELPVVVDEGFETFEELGSSDLSILVDAIKDVGFFGSPHGPDASWNNVAPFDKEVHIVVLFESRAMVMREARGAIVPEEIEEVLADVGWVACEFRSLNPVHFS